MGRTSTGAVVAVLIMGAIGATEAAASAGDDAHVVASPIPNVAPGATATAGDKECPAGERPTGGGVGFVGSGGTGATVIRNTSPFNDAGDPFPNVANGWFDLVTNLSGVPQTYTSFAICSATSDAVVRASQFTTGHEGGNKTSCQPGERALSGGFQGSSGTAALQVSNPLDDGATVSGTDDGDVATSWFVSVRHAEATPQTYMTRVVCSATSTATVQAQNLVVSHGQSGQQSVTCPTGQRALGGGLGTTGGRLGSLGFSGPVDENGATNLVTGSVARGWFADVYNLTGSQQTYKVFVTCEGPSAGGPGGGPGDPAGKTCNGQPATIAGTDEAETLTGTAGDDVIVALGGADTVRARGGNDVVCGGDGPDALKGQGGKDRLFGEGGKDKLGGGGGKGDVCNGGPAKDNAGGSCEKAKKI